MKKETSSFLGSVVRTAFPDLSDFRKVSTKNFLTTSAADDESLQKESFFNLYSRKSYQCSSITKGHQQHYAQKVPPYYYSSLPIYVTRQGKVSSVGLGQKSNLGLGHSFSVAFCSALHPQIWIV